ncbi:DUF86 domain-containing protein [Aquibium carbonis]|uniref:DUF86 domain-containing protein n=1 Tax=Aquibium carbonis TaxID=2495581 RepID=A0A3S0AQ52_9HYPH|nr:HepT-like ribonuclease domain-containing protein [Aquibium carbonis]RST84482.1 DUF86 domain-containing protein [Aquibium carbonis]
MSSTKSPVVRLLHIRHDIEAMIASVDGMADQEIVASHIHRRALERSIEIVSEAAKALPDWLRETEPKIPWKDIIGIGNLLRHEYYRIDDTTMLSILRIHLPTLLDAVGRMERRVPGTSA